MGENQIVTNMDIKTADYKITELFCVIDEFCKHFEAENAGKLLLGEDGVKPPYLTVKL